MRSDSGVHAYSSTTFFWSHRDDTGQKVAWAIVSARHLHPWAARITNTGVWNRVIKRKPQIIVNANNWIKIDYKNANHLSLSCQHRIGCVHQTVILPHPGMLASEQIEAEKHFFMPKSTWKLKELSLFQILFFKKWILWELIFCNSNFL